MHVLSSSHRSGPLRRSLLLSAGALALLAAGCSDSLRVAGGEASQPIGTLVDHPDPNSPSKRFVVEANEGGGAGQVHIVGLAWGRLVKVRDQLGALQHSDMVVGEDIVSDGIDYNVLTNPVTLDTTVTILHPYTPSLVLGGVETSPYQRAFRRLDLNLVPIEDKGLDPGELPPFSLVPRNAVVIVRFDDLIDPALINPTNLRLLTGYPPETPLEARVLPDINHGDLHDGDGDGVAEFHTTRILFDAAVTPLEAASSDPIVSPNTTGFPSSVTTNQPNIVIRIPTRIDTASGQNEILRNLSGHPVAFNSNGSRDDDSATRDVLRAARSGGLSGITGDTNNGFLDDQVEPRVLGSQPVFLGQPAGGPEVFTSTVTYLNGLCAMPTKVGDVIQQPSGQFPLGVFAEVTAVVFPVGSQLPAVSYRVIFPANGFLAQGQGTLSTVWDPTINLNKQACFVRFPSIGQPPATRVAPDSAMIVKFNEPMDPDSINAFDTVTITNFDPATPPVSGAERGFAVARVTPSTDVQEYRFEPILPLRHVANTADPYWVNVPIGARGPFDLAGNSLANALPPVLFTLDPTEGAQNTANLVLRFSAFSEIPESTNPLVSALPEVRGQVQVDFIDGELEPRQVIRTALPIDRTRPTVNAMTPVLATQPEPLIELGSKVMSVWRHVDMGLILTDDVTMNMDVEGMAWAPSGGNVVADVFDRFQVTLAHSKRVPDEGVAIDMAMAPVTFPNSGLLGTYVLNFLNTTNDPPLVVHPRDRGYAINPAERFTSTTGTVMLPWPVNRGIPDEEKILYTWRDTALLDRGGADSFGMEMAITFNLGLPSIPQVGPGTPMFPNTGPWGPGNVPSIGLPLLWEIRCYPDDGALGLNQFDLGAVVLNGAPATRAFSNGGVATGGITVIKDPDLQTTATGGFNPASTPPGFVTVGLDNGFYLGQLNLVSRISRAHTIWFDTPTVTFPRYVPPLVHPAPESQPTGTEIVLAFRGATQVTAASSGQVNASLFDAYGDINNGIIINAGVTFHTSSTGGSWKSEMDQINGAELFQTRITFIGNAQTSLTPTLSSLGFAWRP